MSPEDEKITDEIIDSMPDWFWSRQLDDNCVCGAEDLVPECQNKRCVEEREKRNEEH